jgi:hypothetical protein
MARSVGRNGRRSHARDGGGGGGAGWVTHGMPGVTRRLLRVTPLHPDAMRGIKCVTPLLNRVTELILGVTELILRVTELILRVTELILRLTELVRRVTPLILRVTPLILRVTKFIPSSGTFARTTRR